MEHHLSCRRHILFIIHGFIRTQIESFSLQILHQPIAFNAKGCFSINYDPLRDVWTGMMLFFNHDKALITCFFLSHFLTLMFAQMIGAITTYMVFFVQFTPKLKTTGYAEE